MRKYIRLFAITLALTAAFHFYQRSFAGISPDIKTVQSTYDKNNVQIMLKLIKEQR